MSSSYEFEDPVADKLQAVTNEEDEVGVVTSLKDEGALKVAVPQTLPEDVADDQLPIVGMKSIFKKVWKCLKKGGGGEEEEEEDHDDYNYDYDEEEEEEEEEDHDDYNYDYDEEEEEEEEDHDDYNYDYDEEEDNDVGIIGVYGMGGVGKTTLLTQIKKKLLQMKNDFDVVIWVVDLQHDKIQQQIGEQIGLFDNKVWEDKNFEDKASDIFKILKEKKFVLLMDGLWERVDLTKVGVPLPGPENSSKIVFSTRSLQICSLMEADKLFKVTCLSDDDAGELFKALVGDETLQSHHEVLHFAEDVSRGCRGLPLALVSIGQTMASKKSPEEWSDVLDVLRGWTTSYSGSDDQLKKDIRDNLKLSYDNLQNDMFKSCFLYCCLFPRDREIKKRDLIDCWISEGFLDGGLGAVQSQGHYIIDVFLSVCLLEPGKDDSSVKMHYWIRDMSLWIASKIETEKGNCFFCPDTYNFKDDIKEKQVIRDNLKKATRMSLLNDRVMKMLPDPPRCPLLQTLFLINGSDVISEEAFFNVMPSLKVLNLSSNSFLAKLQSGISNLISLQHLDLSCTKIQELPKELRALKKLKCLNLEETERLHKIPRQLISEFSVLHVLRLWKCGFMLQPNEDSAVCNDAQLLIEELLCLKNLSMLSITFMKNSHALQRLLSSDRLQSCIQSLCLQDLSHPKSIKVPLTDLKHLNELEISNCKLLEELEVDFVGEAQAQDVRESPSSFYFLDKVMITGCPKLRELTWLILAPNLKHLRISDCEEMEEIIHVGKLSECPELMGNVVPFSKLKSITLQNLPILRSIHWSNLPFPDPVEVAITDCPRLPLPKASTSQNLPSEMKEPDIKEPTIRECPMLVTSEIKEPDIKEPTIRECPSDLPFPEMKEPDIKEPTIRECPMLVTSEIKEPTVRECPMLVTSDKTKTKTMPVGELFLSAFLQVLFDRLASRELLQFALQEGIHSKLKRWEKTLMMIQAVLNDAEEKQLKNRAVKIWLDDLRDLAYDVEDILDEFATDALAKTLTLEQNQQASTSKARNLLPACFNNWSPRAIKFNIRMGSEIKNVTSRLKELCKLRDDLGLKEISGGTSSTVPVYRTRPTTSLQTETIVCGRNEDAAKILDMVLSTGESGGDNFRVISIVGMGGIGKTTLAQKVFNDEAVTDFNPKAWTCVSEDFDVLRISKAILESITRSSRDLKELDAVQKELQEAVAGKKFLLVLDDVWSKDRRSWEILRSPFKAGAVGSKIIVTTRDEDVALLMGAPKERHRLKILSDDECWSLFKANAFECREIASYGDIGLIRQKVIEKCKGLPLAVKTLAGLLRFKQEREDEWLEVLSSKIWDLVEESDDIPATLKLSYYYLPSHLKRCFAHCAIFLEDYEFLEEELIHLWMAEGLIQPAKENQQLEDLGHEYFDALLSRSFFQQSSVDESKHTMHDLVHDLAKWASGGTCYHLEEMTEANKQLRSFKKVRHLSFAPGYYDGKCKFEVLKEVEQHLRTFLPNGQGWYARNYITNMILFDTLPKLKTLRALSLRRYRIIELPNSIGSLKHLRYLNLAYTEIRSLPESTTSLYNLQILLLTGCRHLKKLPSNFRNLINLRHLDIRGASSIAEMPVGLKELKSLQKLSDFILGKNTGSTLKDLKSLESLCGELCISRLNNVVVCDPRDLVLRDKMDLKELSLEWEEAIAGDSCSEVRDENVLDMLRPYQNLQKLTIKCYGGTRFPHWVGDPSFSKMTVLKLKRCVNCTSLPSFGLLSSLKHLTIRGMQKLKILGSEIYGVGCSKPFQSLETLYLKDLTELEHWETIKENEHVGKFPCLRELSIIYCPKLSGRLPDRLPSLEKLVIKNCEQLVVSFSSLPMLCELTIDGCKGITRNSPTDFKSLKSMTLEDISDFGNWFRQENFQKVEFLKLKITGCEQLMNLWKLNETFLEKPLQGLQSFISMTELLIENCSNLVSFPEVCFLSNLSKLEIINCNALTSLPKGIVCNSLTGQLPSSLKYLVIMGCEKLEYLWDDKGESSTSVVDEENNNNTSTSHLEYLEVKECPSLKCLSSSGHLPKELRTLSLDSLPELESIAKTFLNSRSLEEISVRSCNNLKSIPKGLHNLIHLRKIVIFGCESIDDCLGEEGPPKTNLSELEIVHIEYCEKLKALPNWFHSLNSLKSLTLKRCPSMTTFPEEGFPTNLTSLSVEGLNVKMYKAVLEWGLHNLTSLTSLDISGLPEAESFPQQELEMTFPPSLTHLTIFSFPNLKCLMGNSFRNLNSLEYLFILGCPNLISFPELALPSSLKSLFIISCPNLKSFSKLGLPSSLSELRIWCCPKVRSFPELGLPSSLSELWIWCCPKVRSFPELGLPSSLLYLNIQNCPKLKEECKRDKGKEWSKISHIPCVKIDWKYIYDPLCFQNE